MDVIFLIIKIYAFILYTLIIWCAAASIWYENGLKENLKNFEHLTKLMAKSFRFATHLYSNNIQDACKLNNSSCVNCHNKIELFDDLFQEYFEGRCCDDLNKIAERLEGLKHE